MTFWNGSLAIPFCVPTDLIIAIFSVCKLLLSVSSRVVVSIKIELLSLLSNDLLMFIPDYVGWLLTGNRKQKNMCNFWPKQWMRSLTRGGHL